MGKLGIRIIEKSLRKAHEDQREETINPPIDHPQDTHNIFVLFNIQAVKGEGHAILGLGPKDGPIETYSYYREGDALKAPALMACLRTPEAFESLIHASGWLIHGNPGNWWNEHVDAALAMSCTQEAFAPIHAYAEKTKGEPGTYDLVSNNCLNFVEDALKQGGIKFKTHSGHSLHNIAPSKAFEDARGVKGAHKFGYWKYWFAAGSAPDNSLRTIPAI